MNIEHIAIGIKDAHGLDMSDEAAITLLRHALSKLAEQSEPILWTTRALIGTSTMRDENYPVPLYTEAQYLAAQQRTAEACAKVCDDGSVKLLHFLEQKGAEKCAEALRFGEWRDYL